MRCGENENPLCRAANIGQLEFNGVNLVFEMHKVERWCWCEFLRICCSSSGIVWLNAKRNGTGTEQSREACDAGQAAATANNVQIQEMRERPLRTWPGSAIVSLLLLLLLLFFRSSLKRQMWCVGGGAGGGEERVALERVLVPLVKDLRAIFITLRIADKSGNNNSSSQE